MMKIIIKRVYDEPKKLDGKRVLIDRLWPRGLSKEEAGIDLWHAEVAPSTKLRQWFGHDSKKWEEFKRRYLKELKANKESVKKLKDYISPLPCATLLFAARSLEFNHAIVLKDFLKEKTRSHKK